MVNKIQPEVRVEWSNGNDGRDGGYILRYYCPNCHKWIRNEDTVACDECGTFFDWSKHAHIIMQPTIVWS